MPHDTARLLNEALTLAHNGAKLEAIANDNGSISIHGYGFTYCILYVKSGRIASHESAPRVIRARATRKPRKP